MSDGERQRTTQKCMNDVRFSLYSALVNMLPAGARLSLAKSAALAPIRDILLRKNGSARVIHGDISWEGWRFSYAGPYKSFYKAKEHGIENRICRLARATLRAGDAAVDVGANYGFVSSIMAKSVLPGGRLISFEIDTRIADVLRATMMRNNLEDTAIVVPQGAGEETCGNFVKVDDFLEAQQVTNIRFFKVDTDGTDYKVLLGATRLLARDHPVVVVEMGAEQEKILRLLSNCGYQCFQGTDGERLSPGRWPENLIASTQPVSIPRPGLFLNEIKY